MNVGIVFYFFFSEQKCPLVHLMKIFLKKSLIQIQDNFEGFTWADIDGELVGDGCSDRENDVQNGYYHP